MELEEYLKLIESSDERVELTEEILEKVGKLLYPEEYEDGQKIVEFKENLKVKPKIEEEKRIIQEQILKEKDDRLRRNEETVKEIKEFITDNFQMAKQILNKDSETRSDEERTRILHKISRLKNYKPFGIERLYNSAKKILEDLEEKKENIKDKNLAEKERKILKKEIVEYEEGFAMVLVSLELLIKERDEKNEERELAE